MQNNNNQSLFSWRQFWISMIYENLPPVLVSPLAALVIERSFSRAFNVCQNRSLFLLPQYGPRLFFFIQWLVAYPCSWLITAGMVSVFVYDVQTLAGIDPLQMICAYGILVYRRIIISVKYGYFAEAEFDGLSEPAPEWDWGKGVRKLIARGWATPKEFPGLIEEELDNAVQLEGNPIATVQGDDATRPDLKGVALEVLNEVYGLERPSWHTPVILVSVFGILGVVVLTKLGVGDAIIGGNPLAMLVNLATYVAILSGLSSIGFVMWCAFDFERRTTAASLLDQALVFNHDLQQPALSGFDIYSPWHMNGWMAVRKVVRGFGQRYLLRVQAYTSILIGLSVLCAAFVNLIIWTQVPHHLTTVTMLCTTTIIIAAMSAYAMYRGTQYQQQSYTVIARLQEAVLNMEVQSVSADNQEAAEQANRAKNILRQVEENVNFQEIVYRPIVLLGFRADRGLAGSILGLLITGAMLALQGYVDTDLGYSATGWSE